MAIMPNKKQCADASKFGKSVANSCLRIASSWYRYGIGNFFSGRWLLLTPCFYGGAKGSRTPDLLNAIQALYQLSYGPIFALDALLAALARGVGSTEPTLFERSSGRCLVNQPTPHSPSAQESLVPAVSLNSEVVSTLMFLWLSK
jgi:hypothetical protein